MSSATIHRTSAESVVGSSCGVPFGPIRFEQIVGSVGFRVDGPNGRLGTVVGALIGAWTDRPDGLEVESGLFRRRIDVIPIEAITEVHPARRRIVVDREPRLSSSHMKSDPEVQNT